MSETPSLTGSLAGLTSLLGNLKGMLQKSEIDAAGEVPIANPVCAWSSTLHDGDLAQFPLTRFVTNGVDRFLAEQATSRAAMGEPIWKALPLNLPPDALAWLASSWIQKASTSEAVPTSAPSVPVDQLQALHKAVHSLGTLVRALAEGEIQHTNLQKAAHQTLALLGLTTGAVLRQNERGFYITSNVDTTSEASAEVKEATSIREGEEVSPEAPPKEEPTPSLPKERLRIEWMVNEEVRKAVYDPHQQVIRYYQGATEKPTFVLSSICTEPQFISFVESLKRVHA